MSANKKNTPGYIETEYGRIPFTDANLPTWLEITEKDIEEAKCGDPRPFRPLPSWRA